MLSRYAFLVILLIIFQLSRVSFTGATSFCASVRDSMFSFLTLFQIQGMLACAKMFIVIGVGLDESFIAQTVAVTEASIARKRKARSTSVRVLCTRGEELLHDLWHTLVIIAPLVSTVKKRWSSSKVAATRQQDLQSIFEQSPQYIWVLQATANRIPKNDVRANELLLFFFRSPVTKNLFAVHPDLDSCKRSLSRLLLDSFAASCSSYRSSGLSEDNRNMLQLFALVLSVRGVSMQLLMEPSTQKIVLDAVTCLKNQVDRMSTAPRLLHLEAFSYIYCGFCTDGIGLLEACFRSRFIGARLKEAIVLHLNHINTAVLLDQITEESRKHECCTLLQKLSDSFCVETVSQSVAEVAAAIENVGSIDVHALLGQTDELPQDIIVRVDGKSGEHTVCGNDLMRFEGGKYSEKHIAWVRRTGGGGEPCPFVLLQRNVYANGAKKRRFASADVSICSCVSGKSSLSGPAVIGCGAWCMNRCSLVECTPGTCPCGDLCSNQKFLRCKNTPLRVFKTSDGRGWGIRLEVAVKKDDFIIEYMGEVVGKVEYERRKRLYVEQQEKNTYFMQLQNDPFLMIDASRKSSIARFTNHSCRPNCYTQKWNSLGQPVVGIFAAKDIIAGTEVTIDYQMPELYRSCRCGAVNCKGNIDSL